MRSVVGNFPNETGNGSHDDQPSKDRRKPTQAGVVGHYSPAACHDGIPRGASRSDPRSLYPSPSFGPIRGKASWLAHRSRSPDPTRGGRRADIALSIGLA